MREPMGDRSGYGPQAMPALNHGPSYGQLLGLRTLEVRVASAPLAPAFVLAATLADPCLLLDIVAGVHRDG